MRNKFIFLGLVLTVICLSITSADARLCFMPGGCNNTSAAVSDKECNANGYIDKADCEAAKGKNQKCTNGARACWYPECTYEDTYDCQKKTKTDKCALDEHNCAYSLNSAEICQNKGYTETGDKSAGAGANCWQCNYCDDNPSYFKCEERSEKNGYAIVNGACVSSGECDGMSATRKDGNCWDCTAMYDCQEKADKNGYKIDASGNCINPENICRAAGYTLTSRKDSNCWSCDECDGYSGLWKCTESVSSGYEIDASGNCISLSDVCVADGYTETAAKDSNCWSCKECDSYSGLWKCEENVSDDYEINDSGECVKKYCPETKTYSYDGCTESEWNSGYPKNYEYGINCKSCVKTTNYSNYGGVCGATSTSVSDPYYQCDELCPGYDLTESEANAKDSNCYTCSSCEDDSSQWKCEEKETMTDNYSVVNNQCVYCDKTETASDCADGEDLVNTCKKNINGSTKTYGDCVGCTNVDSEGKPLDADNPCAGLLYCEGIGRIGVDNAACTCDNAEYYEKCMIAESCNTNSDGPCRATTDLATAENYIYLGEKCKKADGTTTVYWYLICDTTVENSTYAECGEKTFKVTNRIYGKQTCDYKGVGDAVTCGGKSYYDSCETCDNTNVWTSFSDGSSGYCLAFDADDNMDEQGYYEVKEKCTVGSTTYKLYHDCTDFKYKDCNGGSTPVPSSYYGICDGEDDKPMGGSVECGGYTYWEKCLTNCPYDYTKDTCNGENDVYEEKCYDETTGTSYGTCNGKSSPLDG